MTTLADMVDWSAGEYEQTATELSPAAGRVVALAAIEEDERVLDLGCGTGNAALLAARAGAEVTAVDPAERLLSVARERFAAEDLDADFVQASAEELPFPPESFDVVLSVFAVMFAPDPARAASEIVRVLDEDGRAFVTTWASEGPMFETFGVLGRAVAALTPDAPPPKRYDWGNTEAVSELFVQAGGDVAVSKAQLVGEGHSAEAYISRFESVHPVGMTFAKALRAAGAYDEPRAKAIETLQAASEPGDGLRVVNPYFIYTITR